MAFLFRCNVYFKFWMAAFTFNALLYLILTIILLVNRQNAIRPIAIIPIFGIVGSF